MNNEIKQFIEKWENTDKNEMQGTQSFWIDFLSNILGVYNATSYIEFEKSVYNGQTKKRIDGYIPSKKILIEQKDKTVDLNKPIKQSDNENLTPFEQAKRYSDYLPLNEKPKWIIVSNFKEFHIHDMDHPYDEPIIVELNELENKIHYFNFMKSDKQERIIKEQELSVKAGEIVGKIYNELLKQYKDPNSEESLKSINQFCVRLVFCLYAEDAGIFGKRAMFHDYMSQFETKHWRKAIIELFEVLNTPINQRDPYLEEELNAFPYVNGGMFENTNIEIPNFTDELVDIILHTASEGFNWANISPTIFGAVFESTLNPETRHQGGMHYTSIENIHKVIDPLFLNDLQQELKEIQIIKQPNKQKEKAEVFQNHLSHLTFLDPACGSGNFLTETYLSLRRLENETLKIIHGDQIQLNIDTNIIKVSLDQFYGIEINDFAVSVAKTALWIAESQMLEETRSIVTFEDSFLPLKTYTNIVEANALTIDWEDVVPKTKLNYIIGNPPFLGNVKDKEFNRIFTALKFSKFGKLDFVAAWFAKAAAYMQETEIITSFISTNSLCQGISVIQLWKKLFEEYKVNIIFAYNSFKWKSDAVDKAAVHVVIIGFKIGYFNKQKRIYLDNAHFINVSNINAYLLDAPNVFIDARTQPIENVDKMSAGNRPNDNGYLSKISEDEKKQIIKEYPNAHKLFKRTFAGREFINNIPRYSIWLNHVSPIEYRKIKPIMNRIKLLKEYRENKGNDCNPSLYQRIIQPNTNYLFIPQASSEKRRYVPIGYMDKDSIILDPNFFVPNASLYTFGILTSSAHNAWMRTVAGRLEMRYRYSNTIVYNNFPWPEVDEKQKEKIEKTAQAILDARALYPDSSMADLYDELTMPRELRKAHEANDKAVLEAYGLNKNGSEEEIVAHLFEMYQKLTEK